jgi:hypothetical protein
MARKKKEKKENRLRNKFRFSIFNDTSHEELFVFRANGLMMLVSLSLAIIFIIISVTVPLSSDPNLHQPQLPPSNPHDDLAVS